MAHLHCPINGMPCLDGWRKDFGEDERTAERGKCQWWRHVRGKNPQTNEEFDKGDCVIPWLLIGAIEVSQRTMQTGVAIQEVRNTLIDISPPEAAEKAMQNSVKRMLVQATAPSITQGLIDANKVSQIEQELKNHAAGEKAPMGGEIIDVVPKLPDEAGQS
jgi:hypothetical protein